MLLHRQRAAGIQLAIHVKLNQFLCFSAVHFCHLFDHNLRGKSFTVLFRLRRTDRSSEAFATRGGRDAVVTLLCRRADRESPTLRGTKTLQPPPATTPHDAQETDGWRR